MTPAQNQTAVAVLDAALDQLTSTDSHKSVTPELRIARAVRELAAWDHVLAQSLLQDLLCIVVDREVSLRIAIAVRRMTEAMCEAARDLPTCDRADCEQPVYSRHGLLVCSDAHVQGQDLE